MRLVALLAMAAVPCLHATNIYSLPQGTSAGANYFQTISESLDSYQAQSDGFAQKTHTAFTNTGSPTYPMVGAAGVFKDGAEASQSSVTSSDYSSASSAVLLSTLYASGAASTGAPPIPSGPPLLNNTPAPVYNPPQLAPPSVYNTNYVPSTDLSGASSAVNLAALYASGAFRSSYTPPQPSNSTPGYGYNPGLYGPADFSAPEPGAWVLMATGIALICLRKRRQAGR